MKKIALYDIDNTIISIDSFVLFVFYAINKNKIKFFYLPVFAFLLLLWCVKIISTKKFKTFCYNRFIADKNTNINELSKDFIIKAVIPKIKQEIPELLRKQRSQGYSIILATASFEFYLKHLADYLKADVFVGTRFKIDNITKKGQYEGNNCKGQEKLSRLSEIMNFDEIDINNSVSFSDSLTDLPFLDITGVFHLIHKTEWKIIKTIQRSLKHP